MRKYMLVILACVVMGCMNKTPAQTAAEQKKDNQMQVKDKQVELDRLQHEMLCLKVASGDPVAMAEMLVRQTTCGTDSK